MEKERIALFTAKVSKNSTSSNRMYYKSYYVERLQWYSVLALTVTLSGMTRVRLSLTTNEVFQSISTHHQLNQEQDTVTARQ